VSLNPTGRARDGLGGVARCAPACHCAGVPGCAGWCPVAGFLRGESGAGVLVAVDAKVAPLAHGLEVVGVHAERIAVAQVGYGESDSTAKPAGGGSVKLSAPAWCGVWLVQPTFPGAFTAASRPLVLDGGSEALPSVWV